MPQNAVNAPTFSWESQSNKFIVDIYRRYTENDFLIGEREFKRSKMTTTISVGDRQGSLKIKTDNLI